MRAAGAGWRTSRRRSVHALGDEQLTPALERVLPWLYACRRGAPVGTAALTPRDGLGGTALLHARLGGLPASLGRHEHARRASAPGAAFLYSVIATVAPAFFTSRGVAPDVYYEAVILIIAFILTGNAFEARAKRQHVGRRCARSCSCSRRRRAWCVTATEVDIPVDAGDRGDDGDRASRRAHPGGRHACSAARARWTRACSPASRCRWRRRPATA